jgi:hypothetical protein
MKNFRCVQVEGGWRWGCRAARGNNARQARCPQVTPSPYTLHPTPYTLNLSPYTLHPTPYTLHPAPRTLQRTLSTGDYFGVQSSPSSPGLQTKVDPAPCTENQLLGKGGNRELAQP